MAHTSTTITAPVTTSDVATVLAVASHNVGYLCKNDHKKINKWARFKPEKVSTFSALTLAERKINNFGLTPAASYSSKAAFITAVRNKTFNPGWTYTPPSGGTSSPFRLGDFNGYKHDATSPFGTLRTFKGMLSSNTNSKLGIAADAPDDNDGCIKISEMANGNYSLKDWYFGILIVSSSKAFMATTTQPIGTVQDWQVNFGHLDPGNAGSYTGVPFLSSKPFVEGGSEPTNPVIVGIGSTGVDVTLTTTGQTYIPSQNCNYVDWISSKIQYSVSIQNSSTARNFTGVVLVVAKDSNGTGRVNAVSFGTVSVGAGQTWMKTGSVVLADRSYQFCRLEYDGLENGQWENILPPEDAGEFAE